MQRLLLETFEGLNLTDRQKKIFDDVSVENVVLSSENKMIDIYLVSSHVVAYREICLLEYALGVFFGSTDLDIKIHDRFELSKQYDAEAFFKEYKESILQIFKAENILEFDMLYQGRFEMKDSSVYISCEDDDLYRGREYNLKENLIKIFEEKAGFSITVDIEYVEPSNEKEKKREIFKFPSKQKNIQKHDNILLQDSSEIQAGAVMQKTGTDGMGSDIPFDDAAYYVDDMAYAATNMGFDISQGEAAQNTAMGFDVSVPKESAMVSGKDSQKEKSNSPKTQKTENSSRYGKDRKYGKSKFTKSKIPFDEDCFYGRNCDGEITKIADIQDEIGEVIIEGMVSSTEEREIRNEKIIFIFNVTDFTDTITAKIFIKKDEAEPVRDNIKKGKFIKMKGIALYDTFSREVGISSIKGIKPGKDNRVYREDNYEGMKRVELHAHTQMSELDSVMSVSDYLSMAKKWGHTAAAITDHGVVQAFPDADHCLKPDDNLKMLYGVEAYLVDDLIGTVKNDKGQNFNDSFVVFDLETTGFGAKSNQIIEIGAVKVENRQIVDTFSTFVNPERPIPFNITKLTSIDDNMVADYPNIDVILPKFLEFCGDSVMVAHNASFDMGFITQKSRERGYKTDFTVIDTVSMARALLPELSKYKLDTVAKALGVSLENHHRAVDDAGCTAEIFIKLLKKLDEKGISTLEKLNELGKPSVETIRKMPSYHAVILAKNETGRVNLYRLVSESHLKYFNRRPKLPKSLYLEYCEGLMIGSACEAGELYRAILEEKPEEEIDRLVKFYDYLEIQPLGNNAFMVRDNDRFPQIQDDNDLMEINRKIVSLGEEYNKLVVATCDVHFLNPEDEVYRRIIMAGQGFKDADLQAPLYYRTTEEMLSEFQYLGAKKAQEIVITNTNLIADMVDNIKPCSPRKCPPQIENSDQDLRDICYNKAHSIYGPDLPPVVVERLERELNSIISNGYAVMYIIAQKLVWKSNEDGYLVGSRGSVGSSFVATMAGITEVNPLSAHYYCPKCHYYDFDSEDVKKYVGSSACDMPDKKCPKCGEMLCKEGHDIPFETFLGFKGDKEPDIDLNFSSEYQSNAHDYTEVIFGAGHTFRAGTVGTLAEKTAYGYVKKYYEEREQTKRGAEIERISQGCVGVRRSTGQHPGGIVVLPMGEEIYTFTPVQHPANDMKTKIITTHFDYHKIDANLLKLDILGHQDPTMIRMLEDLTGVDASQIRMDDKKVLSLFESTEALGIKPEDIDGCPFGCLGLPEFGTPFVHGMLKEAKPKNFSDLVRISGLSHGTDVWLGNAQYYISTGDCTLSSAICTRDDIMIYLIHMGVENERSFKIMESVRKGKGLTPDMEEDMRACNVPDWYIESCKKIKYMFPKAHAAAYVMMALRVAYFKVHFPLSYYAAFFSIRATSFNYELMCLGKERLEYYMDDYKKRKNELSDKEKDTFEDMKIVQEMYARGFEFVKIDIYRSKANRFQIVDGKLMPAFSTIDGLGDKAAEMIEDEASKGKFLSREDFKNRCKVSEKVVETMADLGLMGDLPHSNQISLMDFMEM